MLPALIQAMLEKTKGLRQYTDRVVQSETQALLGREASCDLCMAQSSSSDLWIVLLVCLLYASAAYILQKHLY